MTYEEKLFEGLEYIVERHKKAFLENCSDELKELVYKHNDDHKEIYIKFNRHSIPKSNMESEYYYFNAPIIVNEMRYDIDSLVGGSLHLCKPEYSNGWVGHPEDVGGFLVRVPEGWNEKYKDKEFVEPEKTESWFAHHWACTDEQLTNRYKYFNQVMSTFFKNSKKS